MYIDIVEGATDQTKPGLRSILKSQATPGRAELTWEGWYIGLGPAFRCWRMVDAVFEHNPEIRREDLRDRDVMVSHCQRLGVAAKPGFGSSKLLLEVFERIVEAMVVQPSFITAHPVEASALARESDSEPGTTDRFGLFVGGIELANGFSELYDPEDKAARFQVRVDAMAADNGEAMHFDADSTRALEYGLPPTEGLGIDRYVMPLANVALIRDVLPFPGRRVRCSDTGAAVKASLEQ
jgi:lysyl-tRNA synthetase, class II